MAGDRNDQAQGQTQTETVGVIVIGLGSVGSTLLAGIEAARANLTHLWGTLSDAGGAARHGLSEPGSPLREKAPLASLSQLALGAFETREDDVYRAAVRAGIVNRALLDELRPKLQKIRAMSGARQAPSRRCLADAIAEDMRGFLAHHGCSRGVVVCTVPGPRTLAANRMLRSPDEIWTALEQSSDDVTAGLLYAAAAAQAGCAFVGAAPDASLCSPGVSELFAQAGLPFAGSGLLGPEAALREALAHILGTEGMGLAAAASLGTRTPDRVAAAWGGPDRAEEIGLASGFAGAGFELSVGLRGPVAAHLAARALDALLLVELASRSGRAGAQDWMEALFAMPLASSTPREVAPRTLAARRELMMAELARIAAPAHKTLEAPGSRSRGAGRS